MCGSYTTFSWKVLILSTVVYIKYNGSFQTENIIFYALGVAKKYMALLSYKEIDLFHHVHILLYSLDYIPVSVYNVYVLYTERISVCQRNFL